MTDLPPPPAGGSDVPRKDPYVGPSGDLRKPRTPLWVGIALVLGLVVGGVLGAAIAGGDDESDASSATKAAQESTTTTKPRTTTTTAPYVPKPEDFQIAIVETRRACFGSAGCSVNFRIDVTYVGRPLSSSDRYTVVYRVDGPENPFTDNFTITGTQYQQQENFVSTAADVPLTATAVNVLKS